MNYAKYTISDFLTCEEFKDWVLDPDHNSNEFWFRWIESHPSKEKTVLAAREIILSMNYREVEEISYEQRSHLLKGILGDGSNNHNKRSPVSLFRYGAIAASIALFISLGFLYSGSTLEFSERETLKQAEVPIIKANTKGRKSVIRLADGSKVYLNANSTLRYYDNYLEKRYLELEGEGYFEVKKNPKNPFIVKSGMVYTTALGTSFNINAKGDFTEVTLVEGEVNVYTEYHPDGKLSMAPMEKIIYSKMEGFSSKIQLQNLGDILWTKGVLYFNQTPVPEVIDQLENWYGVEIEAEGNYQNLSFSSEYKDEYLSNILHTMSFSLDMEYSIERNMVKLKFNKPMNK